jgi:hypothetical protein
MMEHNAQTSLLWDSPPTSIKKSPNGVDINELYDHEKNEWVVEKILKAKKKIVRMSRHIYKCKIEYYVLWKGYPKEYATWEPEEHTINCQEKIDEFWRRYFLACN